METSNSPNEQDVLERLRAALGAEPRIDLGHHPLRASFESGTLTVEGELSSVAAKKVALRLSASVSGVVWVVDRIRVAPADRMTDAQVRQHVRDALLAEPALLDCAIYEEVRDDRHLVRDPPGRRGEVTVIVEDGVVTLDGELPSRAHKRLAGVLAWWVPGSRDVVDGLGVTPYEKDNEEEISDAVRMALEKDPFVDASQVRVVTGGGVVGLTGFVSSEAERDMAENDAWYVFGVGDVINRIEVSK